MGKKMKFTPPSIIKPADVEKFKKGVRVSKEVDIFDGQKAELSNMGINSSEPAYVYYPWSQILLKTVGSEDIFTLRTNRNRDLISQADQKKLSKKVVGVAGMSVGSGIALGLAYSGISREIKLADHDELDTSNLNRLRESLLDVGQPKSHIAARHIYELDPFSAVHIYDDGINDSNIDEFFSKPKVDVAVDEIDDFKMKLKLRFHARKFGIPLLMLTSLGDNVLVDLERYDLDKNQRPFNGLLTEEQEKNLLAGEITLEDEKRLAVQLVGVEYIPTIALKSILKIGTELVGRPQLYSTIAVDGGLATYLIKKILLGSDVPAGRYFVKFNELFGVRDNELDDNDERKDTLVRFRG